MIQTFEPHPLYQALEELGFVHHTEQTAENEFYVWFYRTEEKQPCKAASYRSLALLNYPMIDEGLGRITADFWQLTWQSGKRREEICTELKEKFGEKNQKIQVL